MLKLKIRTNLKLIINALLYALILSIVLFGLYTRFYVTKMDIGFWCDDFDLLLNIKYSYMYLFTHPLDISQCCPPLFIMTLKFLYSHFGANHQILTWGCLLGSCLTLILMPILTYKVCKNKLASLLTVSLLSFNPYLLYYTGRIKQYSTDTFFTVFLILFGYIFFSKPVTKRRMIFFSVICIISALFSYTAIIMIACLCFYYLFLQKKDNIKTRIINFLIFIIPWLMIFVPYIINVVYGTIDNLLYYWKSSYIENFEHFKKFICYLFGCVNDQTPYLPNLSFSSYNNFYYLIIPIIIGTSLIIIKKEKYLFCMLILPVFIAEILGILDIYPCSHERFSLWLTPIFIILFVSPFRYIQFLLFGEGENNLILHRSLSFNPFLFKLLNRLIFALLFIILIFYYSLIFDKSSFESIKFFYTSGYEYERSMFNAIVDTLYESDIQEDDIIVCAPAHEIDYLNFFDFNKNLKSKKYSYEHYTQEINSDNEELLDKYIFFYLFKDYQYSLEYYHWIKENMNIIYEYEDFALNKLIKARKK